MARRAPAEVVRPAAELGEPEREARSPMAAVAGGGGELHGGDNRSRAGRRPRLKAAGRPGWAAEIPGGGGPIWAPSGPAAGRREKGGALTWRRRIRRRGGRTCPGAGGFVRRREVDEG